jgi:hypothetical protein
MHRRSEHETIGRFAFGSNLIDQIVDYALLVVFAIIARATAFEGTGANPNYFRFSVSILENRQHFLDHSLGGTILVRAPVDNQNFGHRLILY